MKNICVVDFEATCWPNVGDTRRAEMEIIEIGAVMLDASLNPVKEFQSFVRPARNPVLSDFCKTLTSITQEQVITASKFPEVLDCFKKWIGDSRNVTFASWGRYDYNQLEKDCHYHSAQFPFLGKHLNIKQHTAEKKGWSPKGVGKAAERLGLKFEGTPHRGLDDAKMISKILKTVGL